MSQPVPRRVLATGMAWAVPVVAVGAAAPALAASACPGVVRMSGRHSNGSSTASMSVTFASTTQVCVTGLTARGGSNGGVTLTFTGSTCGTGTVLFTASSSDNGNNVKGSYTGVLTYTANGTTCTSAVTFAITAA